MVSRRKILSRSRDDLNLDSTYQQQGEEEDVWHQKEKLFKVRVKRIIYIFFKLLMMNKLKKINKILK